MLLCKRSAQSEDCLWRKTKARHARPTHRPKVTSVVLYVASSDSGHLQQFTRVDRPNEINAVPFHIKSCLFTDFAEFLF